MKNISTEADLVKFCEKRDGRPETQPVSELAPQPEKEQDIFTPQKGDRVTFYFNDPKTGKEIPVTGILLDLGEDSGKVKIQSGEMLFGFGRGDGYFKPAEALTREQTSEYAQEAAQRLVGKDGKVYFARKDGEYKGKILELTPTYAIQAVGKGSTAVLHRLKDFEAKGFNLLQKGADVSITRRLGRCTASENRHRDERGGGVER